MPQQPSTFKLAATLVIAYCLAAWVDGCTQRDMEQYLSTQQHFQGDSR